MFGARLDKSDNTWRIALHRVGDSFTSLSNGGIDDMVFSSQAKALACATELNTKWWKPYATWMEEQAKREKGFDVEYTTYNEGLVMGMTDTILKYVKQ